MPETEVLVEETEVPVEETEVPVITAIDLALNGVSTNAEWTPYTEEITGVEMALVPAGCYMMGTSSADIGGLVDWCREWITDGSPEDNPDSAFCDTLFNDEAPGARSMF